MINYKIAFVTYETPITPAGGIASVVSYLPKYLKSLSSFETVVISPYHSKIMAEKRFSTSKVSNLRGNFYESISKIELHEYKDDVTDIWFYFIKSSNNKVFNGFPHPYRIVEDNSLNDKILLHDSVFFSSAIPYTLQSLDNDAHWIIMLQDWETAAVALEIRNFDMMYSVFLTLHNSYDIGIDENLKHYFMQRHRIPIKDTMLSTVIPLVDLPVFTVSEQFAVDLTNDVIQKYVLADHLQTIFQTSLVGVDNGPFQNINIPSIYIKEAMCGDYENVQEFKVKGRDSALILIKDLKKNQKGIVWGNIDKFISEDSNTWFIMSGRDDPRQKGYDVAAYAVDLYLGKGGNAKFLFFPIPGDEGLGGLKFLENLSVKYQNNILVLPFLWKEGYIEVLRGSTYSLMPSLYEPFGAASEFYYNGTIGIARATGGLVQQIIPLRGIKSFSYNAAKIVNRWHNFSEKPSGLLFRESYTNISDWRLLNSGSYSLQEVQVDRLEFRRDIKTFISMAYELSLAIDDAVKIFEANKRLYYQMLSNGINHIENCFSWDKAAAQYLRYIVN